MITRSGRSAAIIATVLVAGGSLSTGVASANAAASTRDYITFYGYTDNNPPGRAITHPCLHKQAGGTGTYADPVTFAQGDDNGPWCQRIYLPFLHKYFIHEDSECGDECTPAAQHHVDLWMGGDKNSTHDPEKTALLDCEDQWTTHDTVILNPPKNEPVDATPMFTPPTTCHGGTGD